MIIQPMESQPPAVPLKVVPKNSSNTDCGGCQKQKKSYEGQVEGLRIEQQVEWGRIAAGVRLAVKKNLM